ncbi:MAG: alanine--tRNA ligase [Candidatus Harrisonbacteria bacterium]|nr:alanine--tRNA ligase [Candidatus Harrisonbacteria bacterium]
MDSEKILESFLNFFKKQGHVVVPSSSLIPDDPSVLLTTAGMQQFKEYFTGELDPVEEFGSKNVASLQKSFRTSDIDEVGDKTHLTFFEMLGNFSFGGYFKKEAITYAVEFLEKELGIKHERITATYFGGDKNLKIESDKESYQELKKYFQDSKISAHGRADNFWGPTGSEGPCGPTVEFYVDGVEIWNLVFNEYYCKTDKSLEPLKIKGVDTGMGLERLTAMMQSTENVFATDIFEPLLKKIKEIAPKLEEKTKRVLADHLRASIFLIADGVRPSNKEAGYILRRLLRRVLAYQVVQDIHTDLFEALFDVVKEKFSGSYPEIEDPIILEVIRGERDKFQKAIALGIKELKKYKNISAKDAFYIYETFGLPLELVRELAPQAAKGLNKEEFEKEFSKHQEVSRAGVEKKFGGHGLLLNTGELKAKDEEELKKVTRLHTATHLMQAALRKTLGPEVKQMGSDITAERTRFDFAFPRKLTSEEIKKVESLVQEVIDENLPMRFVELPKKEAEKTGALFFFKQKYPDRVRVYYAGHSLEDAFSKEFCGGPHVTNTLVIGKFKILKEEAVGAGVRRIRATVEP